MPYKDIDDGHRIGLTEDVISHSMHVFDQGFQLEAILLAHEYLEQKLNALYKLANSATTSYIAHRKFKQLIDLLRSDGLLMYNYYYILNEFNRLRNVNSNQILNFSLGLLGAKKGDMIKAMDLAQQSEQIISKLFQQSQREKGRGQKLQKSKRKRKDLVTNKND
jgi:S-adenosylmethionine:tRNA-ribosyltransferase-isomerase (queuine synthetase)